MGMPVYLLHLIVLFDLRVNKSADSLEEMLDEFPEYSKDLGAAPGSATCVIRQIMNELLENEVWFPYFQKMLDCLGPRILLHEATDETPHLLSRVLELCDEEYILGIYNQLASLEGIEENACSAYVLPFKIAYLKKMFRVIEHLYAKGAEYGIQVDQAVCGSIHPLCFATFFFPGDTESSVRYAKAYLNGTRTQDDRGIHRGSEKYDPDCIYRETMLESIVKSGRCDIIELVTRQGANINALTREGHSLLDVSEGKMKTLLESKGAQPGERKDHLLLMSILGVKQQASERLQYINELIQADPCYTHSTYTETEVIRSYWTVDLLSEAIAFADVEALQLLLPVAKNRLYSHQTIVALKRAIRYCIDDIFSVNCKRIAKTLQLLNENGMRFLYEIEQKEFVLSAVEDLIHYNRLAQLNEDDTIIDIAYHLCELFHLHPVNIYRKALITVSRNSETVPSRELIKELFIPRGWTPRTLKNRKGDR